MAGRVNFLTGSAVRVIGTRGELGAGIATSTSFLTWQLGYRPSLVYERTGENGGTAAIAP